MNSEYFVKITFTTPKNKWNLFAWLIRRIMGTKFSHVMLEINEPDIDRVTVCHSSAFGVNYINQSYKKKKYDVIYSKRIDIDREKFIALNQFCEDNLDKKYGVLTILGLYLLLVFGMLNRIGKDNNKTFICSEFVAKALKSMKICLKTYFGYDVDRMTPHELYVLVRKLE